MSTSLLSETRIPESLINKFLLSPHPLHQLVLKDYTDAQKPRTEANLEKQILAMASDALSETPSTEALEVDPLGKSSKEPGSKLDARKPDMLRGAIQYFPRALSAVAHVSELGAAKYSWKGWESVPNGIQRYGAALARHLCHEYDTTDSGPGGLGSDVLHASQVAWNALARLELILKELDARTNP
jgi:hypothetical protein